MNVFAPQANDAENVESYRFELYDEKGKKMTETYRLSCTFYRPVPQRIIATFDNLDIGQYKVVCYAVNSWGKTSLPLSISFV